jgi:hypothetical protein
VVVVESAERHLEVVGTITAQDQPVNQLPTLLEVAETGTARYGLRNCGTGKVTAPVAPPGLLNGLDAPCEAIGAGSASGHEVGESSAENSPCRTRWGQE